MGRGLVGREKEGGERFSSCHACHCLNVSHVSEEAPAQPSQACLSAAAHPSESERIYTLSPRG